jgi:hypothetical protein
MKKKLEPEKAVVLTPINGKIGKVTADEDTVEIKFSTFGIHPDDAAHLLMLAKKEV